MDTFSHTDSIFIDRSPESLYQLISDVTRMGEWSPICTACWWDEGSRAQAGDWFTGRNETAERTWETRSKVTVAEPGKEFTFLVGGKYSSWSYTFSPSGNGTQVTETWHFLPDGIAFFHEKYGANAQAQIDDRIDAAHSGIPATLAAIKKTAESA